MSKDGFVWRAAFLGIASLVGFLAIATRCSSELDQASAACDGLGSAMCPERGYVDARASAGIRPEQHDLQQHELDQAAAVCDGLGSAMCPERGYVDAQTSAGIRPEQHDLQQHGELKGLIDRLEGLVDRLAVSVLALDSTARNSRRGSEISGESIESSPDSVSSHPDRDGVLTIQGLESSTSQLDRDGSSSSSIVGSIPGQIRSTQAKTRVVARYKPAWSDHFQFLSAIHIDAALSCLHVLPHDSVDGMARYIAVGDEVGHLYVFNYLGDLLVDRSSPFKAAITAMVSVVLRRNETLLVAGYSNGAVVAYKLWESFHRGAGTLEDWTSLTIEYSHTFTQSVSGGGDDAGSSMQGPSLELYRVGRMRYLLVADAGGTIKVFRDNGTLYGSAEAPSRPLSFVRTSSAQRLVFLTAVGAASLDLRTMTVRTSPCEGLHNSSLVAYAFDTSGRSKAYGVTEDGELISLALSGDTLHFGCHVRSRRKLDLQGRPFRLHGLRGYILIATPREVAVYNTTPHPGLGSSGNSRSLFSALIEEISQAFLTTSLAPAKQPLLVCDRDKLVVMGFGQGYVGMFRSNLPVHRPGEIGAKFWGGPIVITAGMLSLAWFFMNRNRNGQGKLDSLVQTSTAAAASTAAPTGSTGFGAASSVTATNSSGEKSGIVLRSFDRTGLAEQKKLLEETRRFVASPSRGLYGGGSGGTGYPGVYS